MEPRAEAIAVIDHVRSVRRQSVDMAARGDIASLLHSTDDAIGLVYVVKLLDVHPALGKVSGRRLLASLGLDHFARISDLSDNQIARILEACGVAA